jgi:hypothetical protein
VTRPLACSSCGGDLGPPDALGYGRCEACGRLNELPEREKQSAEARRRTAPKATPPRRRPPPPVARPVLPPPPVAGPQGTGPWGPGTAVPHADLPPPPAARADLPPPPAGPAPTVARPDLPPPPQPAPAWGPWAGAARPGGPSGGAPAAWSYETTPVNPTLKRVWTILLVLGGLGALVFVSFEGGSDDSPRPGPGPVDLEPSSRRVQVGTAVPVGPSTVVLVEGGEDGVADDLRVVRVRLDHPSRPVDWRSEPLGEPVIATAGDDQVFAVLGSETIRAFDAKRGTPLWAEPAPDVEGCRTCLVVIDGTTVLVAGGEARGHPAQGTAWSHPATAATVVGERLVLTGPSAEPKVVGAPLEAVVVDLQVGTDRGVPAPMRCGQPPGAVSPAAVGDLVRHQPIPGSADVISVFPSQEGRSGCVLRWGPGDGIRWTKAFEALHPDDASRATTLPEGDLLHVPGPGGGEVVDLAAGRVRALSPIDGYGVASLGVAGGRLIALTRPSSGDVGLAAWDLDDLGVAWQHTIYQAGTPLAAPGRPVRVGTEPTTTAVLIDATVWWVTLEPTPQHAVVRRLAATDGTDLGATLRPVAAADPELVAASIDSFDRDGLVLTYGASTQQVPFRDLDGPRAEPPRSWPPP